MFCIDKQRLKLFLVKKQKKITWSYMEWWFWPATRWYQNIIRFFTENKV